MVICDWCKPLTGLSDLEISQNQNPDENLRAPFIYMMQCPLAFLDPLDPPSPPQRPQKFQNDLKTALLR